MTIARVLVVLGLLAVLGVPLALRSAPPKAEAGARTLIVITPHVQQIRWEFASGFDRWLFARTGTHARVDFRAPGGTTEIIKQLEAAYAAAHAAGAFDYSDPADPRAEPGTIGFDLMFGGGSFDHGRLKRGIKVTAADGTSLTLPMSRPAGFSQADLDECFGENRIGVEKLYDPDQYWIGTALSSFGIVYNREILRERGLPDPESFADLADPRYAGWVALADPRLSGSITTSFDSILNNQGWDRGWEVLRLMSANTRYFTNSSTRPPIDVSQGEAAAGLAIDFYGRGQAQAIAREGVEPRVAYVDPAGAVFIDPDPISILRGGPNPDLARLFLEFVLSEEGQALWQFSPRSSADVDGLGPDEHALRRLPVRRSLYHDHFDRFTDRVDPYAIASGAPSRGWRSAIGIMMGAFAIDSAHELRSAWRAIIAAEAQGRIPPERIAEARRLLLAFPSGAQIRSVWSSSFPGEPLPDDAALDFTPENFKAIDAAWRASPRVRARMEIVLAEAFKANYRQAERCLTDRSDPPTP